jgi:hypothetical protein
MATVPSGQKFHTVASTVVTTNLGSALANAQREIYTMEDITSTVRPYKVFSALLTQNGGSVPSSLSNNPLTIGVTYMIDDNGGSGWDFTNVGAPNNEVGTYFVATGTTPNNWGGPNGNLYYNLGAPVATVLENTIGDIWFSYIGDGYYLVSSDDLFTDKITVFSGARTSGWDGLSSIDSTNYSNSSFNLSTVNNSDSPANGLLDNTPIEIRVYE